MANPFNFPFQPAPDDSTMSSIKAFGAPQGNRMPLPPAMPAPKAVESFDLRQSFGPSRSMVTGDRSLTRNPSGRAGLPLAPMGEQIGSRGMTDQRRSEIAGRRLSSAMRAGDMRATELLYRGPNGYGRGFGPPPGRGYTPPLLRPDSLMPQPAAAAPQAPAMPALPPPMSTEQALGLPGFAQPAAADNQPAPMPMAPNLPWQGQPLPGFDSSKSLPPSTLMGGAGLPPPPRFSETAVGGMNLIVDNTNGKQVGNYKPEPLQPPPLNNDELRRLREGGYRPTGVFLPNGQPQLEPLPAAPQPTERVTEGPNGTTRTYTQPRGTQAAPAGGGASNYFDSLPAEASAELKAQEDVLKTYRARGTTYGKLPPADRKRFEEGNNQLIAKTEAKIAAIREKFAVPPKAPATPGAAWMGLGAR